MSGDVSLGPLRPRTENNSPTKKKCSAGFRVRIRTMSSTRGTDRGGFGLAERLSPATIKFLSFVNSSSFVEHAKVIVFAKQAKFCGSGRTSHNLRTLLFDLPALLSRSQRSRRLAFGNLGLRGSQDVDLLVNSAATVLILGAGYYNRFDPPAEINNAKLRLLYHSAKIWGSFTRATGLGWS